MNGDVSPVDPTNPRVAGAGLVAAGLVHLAVPGLLLGTARVGYGVVLDVRFCPGDASRRRVRAVGVAFLLGGAHLIYHGAVVPEAAPRLAGIDASD